MRKFFLLICFFNILTTGVFAQQEEQVSVNFDQSNIEEVVRQIESQTNYHFFYDRTQFENATFTMQASKVYLPSLLTRLFDGTGYSFVIGLDKRIFLTKGNPVPLNLPEGFLSGEEVAQVTEIKVRPQEADERVVNTASAIENKLFEIGHTGGARTGNLINISGYVRNEDNGEELSGVSIYVDSTKTRILTDQFGYFSLFLPPGRHSLNFSYIGMFDTRRQVLLLSDGKLDVDMKFKIIQLKEVVIEPEKERNVRSTTMGLERLSITAINQIPALMGEVDVLRAVLSLPGVKSVGEASTGMNVRGGATDQNLILFNDANIYNPSHLFGFFSAIDPDVIKNVNLYKSSIPAQYGGRISSVLDIASLDGNTKNLTGSVGIGLLTSKLSLNGPLNKEKTTFVLGLRSTYSNWLFKLLPEEYRNSNASFYDGTFHISHKADAFNQWYLNGYVSNDKLSLDAYNRNRYGNYNGNIKWKHNFNSRFYMVALAGIDHYDYLNQDSTVPSQAFSLNYNIDQIKTKVDFSYFLSNSHSLTFGLSSQLYKIQPGKATAWNHSLYQPDELQKEQALETALYFSDNITVTDRLSVEAGVRLNIYNYLGPQQVNVYTSGLPIIMENLVKTETYGSGAFVATYIRPDIRASLRYMLTEETSLKFSYNSLNQFIHQISNTAAVTPTDIWKLSDKHIKPQSGNQVSVGLYRNFKNNTIEASLEGYYKWIGNYLDYKSGAQLLMNHHIETDVFKTKSMAYGVELMIKKPTGKVNGWLTYNYSRALLKQNDPLAGELINNGDYYPANFDQPHNATFTGNLKISHRFSISLNAVYSTGRPITLPIGVFDYQGAPRVLYSDRNAYRIPDYFRADFSMNIDGNHKVHQKTHNSWTIGLYNLTGRKNPYSLYFVTEGARIQGYRLSVFGTVIPYVTFNIRF
ncbi:MAG: TonB-dependent receptor [Chitinophagaceae bacterium]|nr:TonB-dependent receptor [Chitinophagaceae bacterium]